MARILTLILGCIFLLLVSERRNSRRNSDHWPRSGESDPSCDPSLGLSLCALGALHFDPTATFPMFFYDNKTHLLQKLRVFAYFVWDIVGLLQGSKRPLPGKLRKKSEKGFRHLSAPGSKKVKKTFWKSRNRVENESKTSKKTRKNLNNCHFRVFFELLRPRGREARDPLCRLLSEFSSERPFWPL